MTTKTLAEVLLDEVLDSGTWVTAPEKVRAHVRHEDAARAGTLSAEHLEGNLAFFAEECSEIRADEVRTYLAAQGRTIAALESERDEAFSIYANMLRERDEARAQLAAMTERAEAAERSAASAANRAEVAGSQLAARDARVAELEAKAEHFQRLTRDAEAREHDAHSDRDNAQALQRKAESALATVRRAVGPIVARWKEKKTPTFTPAMGLTSEEAESFVAAMAALDATPAEHPDTATPTTPETVAAARNAVGLPPLEHPDTAALRAIRELAGRKLLFVSEDYTAGFNAAMSYGRDLLCDSGPSGGGETKGEDVCNVCSRPASASQPCPHHSRAPLGKRYTVLVPTTPPPTAENVCEHGDHPAPAGQRYCSPGCQECDGTECGEEVECAGVCRAVPTPSPTPDEDWRMVKEALSDLYGYGHRRETANGTVVQDRAQQALARLRDEPRRAAEAMRERCSTVAAKISDNHRAAQKRMETDAMRTAHAYAAGAADDVAATIRALEVKP